MSFITHIYKVQHRDKTTHELRPPRYEDRIFTVPVSLASIIKNPGKKTSLELRPVLTSPGGGHDSEVPLYLLSRIYTCMKAVNESAIMLSDTHDMRKLHIIFTSDCYG